MYVAYCALRTKQKPGKTKSPNNEYGERYRGYYAACQKYQQEIIAIQKYIPGWQPPFTEVTRKVNLKIS